MGCIIDIKYRFCTICPLSSLRVAATIWFFHHGENKFGYMLLCVGASRSAVQRIARWAAIQAMSRDTRRGVTIEFHAETGQSESLSGRLDTNAREQYLWIHGIPRSGAHFFCMFCSQSLDSVRHFLRWLPYRGTESLDLPTWYSYCTQHTMYCSFSKDCWLTPKLLPMVKKNQISTAPYLCININDPWIYGDLVCFYN